ncbi:MAG: manganese efflux pump MntP family protein [Candidatus Alcyoniella australis]|nr:manganese efflux pump MntP family protein [Candidatus Alcyoniella australis]
MAIGLGGDAFGVALATGPGTVSPRHIFRLSLHAGLFQFLMPLVGWLIGRMAAPIVGTAAAFIAASLVLLIGIKMLIEGLRTKAHKPIDISRGKALLAYSLGTSADALTVGIGVGLLGSELLLPALIFGVVAALMAALGHWLSHLVATIIGSRAEILGGVVLIALGVRMLPAW